MAKRKSDAAGAPAELRAAEHTMLRHAYGNIAYTIYPLPEGDKDKLREAVASLQKRGLLSDTGREPQLTADGRALCKTLSAEAAAAAAEGDGDPGNGQEEPAPAGGAAKKGAGKKGGAADQGGEGANGPARLAPSDPAGLDGEQDPGKPAAEAG